MDLNTTPLGSSDMSAVQQNLSHSHNSPQDVHVNIESERLPVSDRSIGRGGPPITERNEVSGSQYDPGDGIQRSSLGDRNTHFDEEAVTSVAKNPTYLQVYLSIFDYDRQSRWGDSHLYLEPGRKYRPSGRFRHKDCLGRVWIGPEDDRHLSATDGRLAELVVQATEDILYSPANSTWARTDIRNITPAILRVVHWVLADMLENNKHASWHNVFIKWPPACLAIFLLLFIPSDLGGEVRNNGRYEQFKYHYWGYSKVPSNPCEYPPSGASLASVHPREENPLSDRPLRPRYLCVLRGEMGISVERVSDWEEAHATEPNMEYLFVAYTAEQFSHNSFEDMEELHRIAEAAARRARVRAYWIACSCMPDEDEQAEDIYRISDVVRGAHSLVVIIGPPTSDRRSGADTRTMLRHWASRMWTFPEVLLSPANHPISIYTRGGDLNNPWTTWKRNFAAEAWEDAPTSRQLVDHYEGSIILSSLELVSVALQCLPKRHTNTWYDGDMSYALMGLLRRRPKVNETDTAFQAFCRLSLANDSNQLLERLICTLPRHMDQPWYTIEDFWDRHLWDIDPLCQVVGIGEGDTVILSGAFGAPIRWKSFALVNLLLRNTVKRSVARVALRGVPAWFAFGAFMLVVSKSQGGSLAVVTVVGWLFMGFSILVILLSPYLLRSLYVGKTWAAQPWLFGFEGYLDIGTIETNIFGGNLGRLRWSTYGSDLSRHANNGGECVGIDPTTDADVMQFVRNARESQYGELKLFTLVDTNTLTVTLFRAVRPPVALLLCGSEGGMQRALLCSYDWKSQTLYRESVLRMDTLVLEKMSRVDRFRLGLKRPVAKTM